MSYIIENNLIMGFILREGIHAMSSTLLVNNVGQRTLVNFRQNNTYIYWLNVKLVNRRGQKEEESEGRWRSERWRDFLEVWWLRMQLRLPMQRTEV